MIISLANQKGGVGKTTIAVHLAHAIALAKKRVLLADADPQASAGNWAAAREDAPPFPVVGMARNTLHRDLPGMMGDYDHCVIDSPPRVSALARSAILASDLCLIPVQPSSYDVWAASETIDLVTEAQQFKSEIKAAFLINRRVVGSAIGREIGQALKNYPMPVFSTIIGQRVSFSEASAGYTVMELQPSSTAAAEIAALAKGVLKFMGRKEW